ncbi:MAG TPA: anti-sigma factor [Sphingomonadaceae bacterium]|nr:anti-sigma factor [Sphingomonadaceae bacterium]
MTDPRTDPDEDGLLAAELALRLLEGDALREARARQAAEPAFAAAVEAWHEWLAGLLAEVAPVEPDAAMWGRVSGALALHDPRNNVLQMTRSIRFWRGSAVAATALAASLLLVVGLRTGGEAPSIAPPVTEPRRVLIAAIEGADVPPLAVISVDRIDNSLIVTPAALTPVPGHSHELWIVPTAGDPRSLGLLKPGSARRIVLADDLARLLTGGSTLAISAEDEGGSRTGLPQGPIVATGTLRAV